MERWAVDIGNTTKSAYALKLTSNLLKELESTEQATIKFTNEKTAVFTVNGLEYSLNSTSLNPTEHFYAMQENRDESLLSAVGKVSKKMTANEQATAQYVNEISTFVLPKDKMTTFLTAPNVRGKSQGGMGGAMRSNSSNNINVNKSPLEKKKTRFLEFGDGTENAQLEIANEEQFQKDKIQSIFIGKMIANQADNQTKKTNTSIQAHETEPPLNKKRTIEVDEDEANGPMKRIKPNNDIIQTIEAIIEKDENQSHKIKLKVGSSANNETDLTQSSVIDNHIQSNSNNSNQTKVQTKIKLKIAPTYEHDLKLIQQFNFSPVNISELLKNYPWNEITAETFATLKSEYEKINNVHVTIFNELQTFKRHVILLGDYLKSENSRPMTNIEKCEEIKRAIRQFYEQKKNTVAQLNHDYKTIRFSLQELKNMLTTFMANYLEK
jgi:hypothetical protein